MFEGAKTWVFWVGLVIFALACIEVFSVVWSVAVIYPPHVDIWQLVKVITPVVVGGVVFIIVGFYMMKSGVEKKK